MHGVQCENQADAADHSGGDNARMREFGVEAKDTKNQQNKKNIGLDDAREKLLPRGKFKWRADRAL